MESNLSTKALPRVLIAAGHTGGHLFPALYVALAIRQEFPSAVVEFVGAGKPLEREIIDARGFVRHEISAVGFKKKSLAARLLFVLRLPIAFWQSWKIITKVKPSVVLGAGGYVSFFPVLVARVRGIPTWVHEVELEPGLTNLLLCRIATRCSVAHIEARTGTFAAAVHTGHPLNSELFEVARSEDVPSRPTKLLVVGGSQGADAVDRALLSSLTLLSEQQIEVHHQSRPENVERVSQAYRDSRIKAEVVPFIRDMASAYRWADVVVGRSGAGTTLELIVVNRPSILVPLPNAAGNEQLKNAMTLVSSGKAVCVEEGEGFEARFRAALGSVFSSEKFQEMKRATHSNRPLNGAKTIAQGLIDLAG